MNRMRRQAGFSLVELMVAMVLGLLITAAAISLFSTNQRTFQLQQAQSQLQEQGQLAMRFITDDVRMAGFSDGSVTGTYIPGVVTSPLAGVTLPVSANDDSNGNDRLTLSHHASQDCEGNPAPVPANDPPYLEVVNTYWVSDDGDLKCQGNQSSSSTGGVTLLKHVESFQVLYGIDTQNNDGIPFAGRYVSADQVGSEIVLAVKFSVLLRGRIPSLGSGEEQTYYLLDEEVAVDTSQALFRQFSTTVALRNYPWDRI